MKKYPYIRQDNSNDCGVACLEMVIRYYKGYIPKSELVSYTHTDKKGTTAYHMIEALKQFGFSATGVSCDLMTEQEIICPCIAHVTLDNIYQHYVVIYEIDWKKKTVLIADPARQMMRLKLDEFITIYNQVLIILYPIQKIPIYHKPYSFTKYTLYTIQKHWKIFLPICILSIFILTISFVGTFYISILLNTYFSFWITLLFIFLFLEMIKQFLSYFRSILLCRLNEKLSIVLTCDAFSKIMKLPYLQYYNLPTGDFMARMQDIKFIQEVVSSVAFTFLFDGILFLFSLLFLISLEPTFFPICFLMCTFYFLLVRHYRPIHQKNIFAFEKENVYLQSYILDYMRGFEMVKGLSITDKVIEQFQKRYQTYSICSFHFQKQVYRKNLIRDLLESLGYIGFLGIGIFLYGKGKIQIGLLFAYQMLFTYIMSPIVQFVDSDYLIERAKSALQRIQNLSVTEKKKVEKQELIQSITCNHLSYEVEDQYLVLEDINLKWKSGDKILCMGPSGSGKSTLFKCIKGYYPINENQIMMNEESLNQYDIQKQILYIGQNETLIVGTIYDNITLLDHLDENEVKEVIDLCEIDTIVETNPLKYQMLVEENGSNLSGGERAQIVLARTLLKPFQVLLIDEGFGQMDINLERRILKRLFERYPEKMIAVISHRKDNMDLYDQVLRLEKGKIVEMLERSI